MTHSGGEKDRLIALFEEALNLARPERAAFIAAACGDDQALCHELTSLVEASESAPAFFDALGEKIIARAFASLDAPVTSSNSSLLPKLHEALGDTYRFDRELHGGAMSRVFLAEEIKLGRKVVVKVLPQEMTATVSAERFRREIQVAAQVHHPHIVPLLNSGATDSFLYYTMPYVTGESLRERLRREERVSVHDAQSIWRDVLDALAHAHASGVVHRDIKPANILLSGRNALVADFGISRALEAASDSPELTGTGLVIGTPAYMAPEQVIGSPDADHRVDIYAAALVMYEMLERKSPFPGKTVREIVLTRLSGEPLVITNPDCPAPLADLVVSCLAADPSDRPQTADSIIEALDQLPKLGSGQVPRAAAPLIGSSRRRQLLRAISVTALLSVVVGGAMAFRNRHHSPSSASTADTSIAVLPLKNLSTDPGDAPLAAGMTEELVATLGRAGNIRVMASTSVSALWGRGLTMTQIAESLHVSHVIEGGFQKVGGRVRMQVRLVDTRDGSTSWSQTYDRNMGDILTLEDNITAAVARELDARLGGGSRRVGDRRRYTPSVAAYEWYLRGMNTTLLHSEGGRQEGVDYFNRAIAADSNFAAAYAGFVRMYLGEGAHSSKREWVERAEQAALKAVALDDSLAEAHVALGWTRIVTNELSSAESELKRAVSLDPNVPRGNEGLARLYMSTGHPAEQLAAARKGLANDPYSASAMREYALALSMNGRCDEALDLLLPLKRLNPPAQVAGVVRGTCFLEKKNFAAAEAEFRWAMGYSATAALPFLGYTLARSGREGEARKILADIKEGRSPNSAAFGVAVVYAGLKDYDQAFSWLDKAFAEGSMRVYILLPMFQDLHADPRYSLFRKKYRAQKL